MNQRIKEIADEAFKGLGTNPVYATAMIYASKELEKFAKLIVWECAEIAGCNGHVSGFALGDLIKEHFGVEE